MRWVVCALALIGCGRIDFDARRDAAAGDAGDANVSSEFCTPGASSGCPAGAAFCDDYENSAGVTFPRWDLVRAGNWNTGGASDPSTTLQADGMPCRGGRSMHGHGVGGAQAIYAEVMLGTRPNPMFMRLWFRIASSSPTNGFELVGIHDAVDNAFVHIALWTGAQSLGVNAVAFTTALGGMQGPAQLDVDRWQCLQLRWLFDSTNNGALQISLDGVTAIDATNVVTESSQPMNQLILGVVTGLNETGTYDVDIDEIAIADAPIPCS
jgi:hypothetical protein